MFINKKERESPSGARNKLHGSGLWDCSAPCVNELAELPLRQTRDQHLTIIHEWSESFPMDRRALNLTNVWCPSPNAYQALQGAIERAGGAELYDDDDDVGGLTFLGRSLLEY